MARLHPPSPPPEHRPPPWAGADARMTLWHGTSSDNLPRILAGVDPTKGERVRDFGRGFYTTTYREQAQDWVCKGIAKLRLTDPATVLEGCVFWFRVPLVKLAPLHSLTFVRPEPNNHDFWSFVHTVRSCSGWFSGMVGVGSLAG